MSPLHDHVPFAPHVQSHSANCGPTIAHRSPGVHVAPSMIAGHVEQREPTVSAPQVQRPSGSQPHEQPCSQSNIEHDEPGEHAAARSGQSSNGSTTPGPSGGPDPPLLHAKRMTRSDARIPHPRAMCGPRESLRAWRIERHRRAPACTTVQPTSSTRHSCHGDRQAFGRAVNQSRISFALPSSSGSAMSRCRTFGSSS
jgi:hypothetical protein